MLFARHHHLSTLFILGNLVFFYPFDIQSNVVAAAATATTATTQYQKKVLMPWMVALSSSRPFSSLPRIITHYKNLHSYSQLQHRQSCFISLTSKSKSKSIFCMSKKRNYNKMTTMMVSESSSSTSTSIPTASSSNHNKMLKKKHEETSCKQLLIILAGPTAVGKSSIGSKLCSQEMATDIMTNHALHNHHTVINHSKSDSDSDGDDNHDEALKDNSVMGSSINSRGHIISADSVQVYQGVQIGANKPTKEEIERTPHHLINIVDGDSVCQYNAADWMRDALYVIDKLTHCEESDGDSGLDENMNKLEKEDGQMKNNDELTNTRLMETTKQKKRIEQYITEQFSSVNEKQNDGSTTTILPVIVGGTMMYLQWLVHGRPDAMKPSGDAVEKAASVIAQFKQQEEQMQENNSIAEEGISSETTMAKEINDLESSSGWKAAIDHTSSLGPIFADRVSKLSGKDWYRLRRTLEVAYTVLDDVENKIKVEELYNGQREGGLDSMEYDVRCFFLCPDDRMAHTSVVDSRCEDMIFSGLFKETADLSLTGLLPAGGQQSRAIGYRQALDYLKRDDVTPEDSISFGQYLDEFTAATRRYAKKQMQWFRRDDKFMFIPVKVSDPSGTRVDAAANMIRNMCVLPRSDFDKELAQPWKDCKMDENMSISAKTKLENEKQGKKMKFYRGKRHKLIEGTDEYKKIIVEADESRSRMQGISTKVT